MRRLGVLTEVGAARPHLPVDARLDLALEEGIAVKILSLPRAVPVPSLPPHVVADQTDRTARLHRSRDRDPVHAAATGRASWSSNSWFNAVASPRPVGSLEGEQLRAPALRRDPRALGRDLFRGRTDQVSASPASGSKGQNRAATL